MRNETKKNLSNLFKSAVVITISSLVLTVLCGLLKLTDLAGIFFIILLVSAVVVIGMTLIIAMIILCRDIRANGLTETIVPLLKKFFIWGIVLLILTYISQRRLLIWEALTGSAVLSLISIIDYKKFIPSETGGQDGDTDNISGETGNINPNAGKNHRHLEDLVLAKLASKLDLAKLTKSSNGYYIIDSKNHLGFECGDHEVIVFFAEEHYHIMALDYDDLEALATEAYRFLELFIDRTVRFEYQYHGTEQIRLKLYSLHDNKEELIEDIRTTLNPLLLNSAKSAGKEIKLTAFRQQ